MNKRVLLVVNPKSGKRQGQAQARVIASKLAALGYDSDIRLSRQPSDLQDMVNDRFLRSYHLVGIVGGDGSMHEWVNAVLRNHENGVLPIALFPCGTGNAFNEDIGCGSIDETLDCIRAGRITSIDVAELNFSGERLWSFNILGCGLVADINRMAEKMRWLGGMRYNVASVLQLLRNKTRDFTIRVDEQTRSGRYSFVLACNTRYTGKGMMMAPQAKLHDGKFDVLLVKACSKLTLLQLFPKIFKGTHVSAPILEYFQCRSLEVQSTHLPEPTNVDGEMKGSTPLVMTVHTEKIRVFVKTINAT